MLLRVVLQGLFHFGLLMWRLRDRPPGGTPTDAQRGSRREQRQRAGRLRKCLTVQPRILPPVWRAHWRALAGVASVFTQKSRAAILFASNAAIFSCLPSHATLQSTLSQALALRGLNHRVRDLSISSAHVSPHARRESPIALLQRNAANTLSAFLG